MRGSPHSFVYLPPPSLALPSLFALAPPQELMSSHPHPSHSLPTLISLGLGDKLGDLILNMEKQTEHQWLDSLGQRPQAQGGCKGLGNSRACGTVSK